MHAQASFQNHVADYSAANLTDQLGFVAGTGGMTIEFFYDRIRVTDPANPEAHGTYHTQLCVRKRPHGDRHTESVRRISERAAQQLYPREFAWFKQSQDVPTDGTPLAELPGISQSQIGILLIHGIRCIEDLVALQPDQVAQIGMDGRTAYSLAKRWTEAKAGNAELIADSKAAAKAEAELERLRAEQASNAATIARLQAQIDIMAQMGGAPQVATGPAPVQAIDDGGPDAPVDDDAFSGAQIVTGNDDLMEDAPAPAPALPGLDRGRKK